jgi:arylsulfatase A-like enzyme
MKRLFASLLVAAAAASQAAQQNILLIIADDYGADSSSLYSSTNAGASLPPTPNIESLAQSGVVFRNAYANPVCSPTRACVFTGRHGFRTGLGDVVLGGGATLSASEFTLADAFAVNSGLGYQVAQFGKWHLANGPNSPSLIGGWPHFAGSIQGAVTNYNSWNKTVNGSTTPNYTNYATTDVVNDAVAWIQARGVQPWFAWVAFNAPHVPYHKPPTNLCPHYASLTGTQNDINNNQRKYYEAMTEALDTEIGRLLAAVNRTNTHIIFIGDNGTPGQVIQPPYSSARGKDTLYEGGIKVPFVITGPAVTSGGRTNSTLVHVVDLYSTILEMAGINVATTVPTNVTLDSQSILPALTGTTNLTRYMYAEMFNTNAPAATDGRVLRNQQFKLIRFDTGDEAFYDLLADPTELTNLLSGTMSSTQLANYYSLQMKLGQYQVALTAPTISGHARSNNQFSVNVARGTNVSFSLWRGSALSELAWAPVTNFTATTNGTTVTLRDTNAGGTFFYRVESRGQ